MISFPDMLLRLVLALLLGAIVGVERAKSDHQAFLLSRQSCISR
jgi:uncharacterized membrane protein YhiD involved in acid resistance